MGYAVRFDEVSKRYPRGGPRYASLRQEIDDRLHTMSRRLRGKRLEPRGTLALDGVSFEVEEGEAFAIIGPNGAGKTTALKLISRISYPTSGRVRVRGRVGALIEVGSGVHPELSGRENIWLYGQILGMRKADIRRRFDEIVEFADLSHALDTPVKMYSTGMQLRLGFAIASHLDPDVFVVDEALAVGDAAFQAKCVERMARLVQDGRTLIFVSHNMSAVEGVCRHGVLMQGGRISLLGPIREVLDGYIRAYTAQLADEGYSILAGRRFGTGDVVLEEVQILDGDGRSSLAIPAGGCLRLRFHYLARRRIQRPEFGLRIVASNGVEVSRPNTRDHGTSPSLVEGRGILDYVMEPVLLRPGLYRLTPYVWDSTGMIPFDEHEDRCQITVLPSTANGHGNERFGLVQLPARWSHEDGRLSDHS